MKPKEKAIELADKFYKYTSGWNYDELAKECALIAVNEIIIEHLFDGSNSYVEKRIEYWQEVKQEIENI